jgi:hypothetical protein
VRYLRLRLCTEHGTVLFEKDVEVATVFEDFVRLRIAELLRAGKIERGQRYSVQVVPRYSGQPSPTATVRTGEGPAHSAAAWISLRMDDPGAPDEPVRYFTVEIRMSETLLLYSVDATPLEAGRDLVVNGVVPALLQLGVLKLGDYLRTLFLARDDDQARFDREVIPTLQRRSDELIEFLPDEEPVDFPERSPTYYGPAEVLGSAERNGVSIFMPRDIRARLKEEAARSHEEERGGMLVGDVYRDPGGGWVVEVCDFTVNAATVSNIVVLKHTFETWRQNRAMLRERFAGKRVVGWYHTHLVEASVATGTAGQYEQTRLFFSSDDVFMHRTFFPEPWYVALVLDPDGDERFFVNRGGAIEACPGYSLFDPQHAGSAAEAGP